MIRQRRALFLAAGTVFLVAGLVLFLFARGSGTPGDASADAGFARDMAVHHAQAVEMSFIVRDASSDPAIRTLTYDIIVTQSAQRGMFMGWLQQWGLDQAGTRPPMAWMAGHGSHGGTARPASPSPGADLSSVMPGMASAEELARLKAAKGKDAEILFLQLMIRHHEGGVDMARAALRLAERPEGRTMARHIVSSQNSEIGLMTRMLKERGAEPLPSILNPRS